MMDERQKKLQERYDEALADMVTSEYMQAYGKQLLQQYEASPEEFLEELDAPFLELLAQSDRPQPRKKPRRVLRVAGIVAATIACLFGLMVAAQALGLNVFGNLATWTDDILQFGTNASESTVSHSENRSMSDTEIDPEVQAALEEAGIPLSLMPREIPEGYELSKTESDNSLILSSVTMLYTDSSELNVCIHLTQYYDKSLAYGDYYKDPGAPEEYISGGRRFYIYKNSETWNAVWTDGTYAIDLFTFASKDYLYLLIDSIPEVPYD